MVNLKNYNVVLKHFGLLLTFSILISCGSKSYYVSKIEGKKNSINNTLTSSPEIESFIKPYKEKIDNELSEILAYNPQTLDKSGEWQTSIGNFYSDITILKANPVFLSRENKTIDICVLNIGGIRTIIPKGNVTAKNAYEVMPFENSTVVIGLTGIQIIELANFIITEKKPFPVSGITFTIGNDKIAKNILVQGKPIENGKIYNVVTSDYLANGGDNMNFFKNGSFRLDLDYKLRNILIDYFKDVDTLEVKNDVRISKE